MKNLKNFPKLSDFHSHVEFADATREWETSFEKEQRTAKEIAETMLENTSTSTSWECGFHAGYVRAKKEVLGVEPKSKEETKR